MNENDRERLRSAAHLDGLAVTARNSGRKVEVTTLELTALCNLAEIGLLHLLNQQEPAAGIHLQKFMDSVRYGLGGHGKFDGVNQLCQVGAGLLRSERFQKYLAYTTGGNHG